MSWIDSVWAHSAAVIVVALILALDDGCSSISSFSENTDANEGTAVVVVVEEEVEGAGCLFLNPILDAILRPVVMAEAIMGDDTTIAGGASS